ncbi:glycosyltransferase WbuB [Frigidibacter albus]|uniref:WcaI family glycosyltransferase n=1 Tax=Frigidibacter albus TaxID=1465486 RepID=UPI0019C978A7|nr:WcaI family glycosyltransferase [Frigidibacter albus]GGH63406.1 glycosyltransferase WbuB [Frigidibacter albus]
MRLLILGINYAPEIISTAVYTTGLAEAMVDRGHEVRVVTAHPYYPAWKRSPGYPAFWYRREAPRPGLDVTHCPHYVPARPTGARRILHHASFALTALPVALWTAIRHRPDAVFVAAPALVAAPVGWLAARLGGGKAWLHIQDYEVEAAFATGLLKEDSRIGRAARGFERWILRRFDKVSSISAPMLAKLTEQGIPAERIFELRNWADLSRVVPLTGPSPLKAELGITTPHVALYSGNIANKQGLEIIPAAARLLAHRSDLTFAIFGDGPFLAELKNLSQGLSNIQFFPLQPRDRLSELVGMATVHLLPQIAGAADLVLPSKLTNMLASGRPVLATAEPGTALAGEVAGCGEITPPGDAATLASALERLLDDPARREALGAAARVRALDRWDGSRILDRFAAELHHMTGIAKAGAPAPSDEPGADRTGPDLMMKRNEP